METDSKVRRQVEMLNDIQARCIKESRRVYPSERAEWNDCIWTLKYEGYEARHKTVKDGLGRIIQVLWRAVPIGESKRRRHFDAELKNIDLTPNDGKKTCKGNCTTRAMSYCLQGIFTYREIETEQYRLAKLENEERGTYRGDGRRKTHRNTDGTWDKVMLDFGYRWIHFCKTYRRDTLAYALREISTPMITQSSGHVAVIESGYVVDSWDSRHGRCKKILVKNDDFERIKAIFEINRILWY